MSRHSVVTGAASGIGREIARRQAAQPGTVTLLDFDAQRLAATTAELDGSPAVVRCCTVDLRDPAAADAALEEAWAIAPVDVLVNAAGVYPAIPLADLDASSWDRVQDVNVRAPMLLTVALSRLAIAAGRGASVVNISSGAALRARPGAAAYATSKAALEMATRAAALELGPHGIRVNAVAPGFVEVESSVNPLTEDYAAQVSRNPLGRRGQPGDIAAAVAWISGHDAPWVTGEVLRVDGGASAGASDLPLHWNTARFEAEEASP